MLVDNLGCEIPTPKKNLPCNELGQERWAQGRWVLEVGNARGTSSEASDLANASEIEGWEPWEPWEPWDAWELSLLNLDGAGSREGKGGESDDHGGLHFDDVWGDLKDLEFESIDW